MKCPKCGQELHRSKKDPSFWLCDNCRKKFKLPQADNRNRNEHPDNLSAARQKTYSDPSKKEARDMRASGKQKRYKKKRSRLKIVLIILLLLIVLAVIGGIIKISKDKADTGTKGTITITADQFSQIENGMTYKQVTKIIGGEGEKISEDNTGDTVTAMYQWHGSDDTGNALITFEDGKVVSKTQSGISDKNKKPITKEIYDKIDVGMSYNQVKKLIGCDGELATSSTVNDTSTEVYIWYGDTKDANAAITFENDGVTGKTQIGLE